MKRAWQTTPVFLPGESHGQRGIVGYSPWGHKESDMNEQLSLSLSYIYIYISVQFCCSFVSDSLQPHGLQHAKLPCPSPTPRACSNSCLLSQWCHPTISSSAIPFSSSPQSSPASRFFPMSWLFASGGQSIGASASASVLPKNTQDWSPLEWTGLISL